MGTQSEIDKLLTQLASHDRKEVISAARALSDLGEPRAVEPLIELLKRTEDHGLRNVAALTLRELKDERAIPALVSRH